MKQRWLAGLIALCAVLLPPSLARAGTAVEVFVDPATQMVNVDQSVSIDIRINGNGLAVQTGSVFLQFDTARLSFVSGSNNTATWGTGVTNVEPAETQTGRMFRLKGKGVQSVRSHRTGDLMCRVVLETPVKLSREQKELLQRFENTLTGDNTVHNPRSQSWLKSVREFFDRMTS